MITLFLGSASALGLKNVGGVFLVLIVGLGLALLAAILEFIWKSRKDINNEVIN